MGTVYNDLDEITLSRFIDVYLGDVSKVVKEGECGKGEQREAAARLCAKYLSIVGGRSLLAQISRRDGMLRVQMRLSCLEACRRLAGAGDWEGAREVMGALGYRFGSVERERMMKKMDSVEASDRYRLDKLRAAEEQKEKNAVKADRDYFTRERVAVMAHMKMHIDPDVFKAGEYAWMVRRMCDELEKALRGDKLTS